MNFKKATTHDFLVGNRECNREYIYRIFSSEVSAGPGLATKQWVTSSDKY